MNSRILTVPNQLTFLRLAFLPFFIMAIHYERYSWALVILIVAGFTDALDGFLARGLNQKTPLGAYLDPIADKLLLSSSYFELALHGKIAWWLTILVLGAGRAAADCECGDPDHGGLHVSAAEHVRESHHVFRNHHDISGAGARAAG